MYGHLTHQAIGIPAHGFQYQIVVCPELIRSFPHFFGYGHGYKKLINAQAVCIIYLCPGRCILRIGISIGIYLPVF
ncbi:hypothetical protein D3C87_1222610 [compost metagenome]